MTYRFQIVIQFVNKGLAGRYVQKGDILVADAIQLLDQGTQAVAVGSNENAFSFPDFRCDRFNP